MIIILFEPHYFAVMSLGYFANIAYSKFKEKILLLLLRDSFVSKQGRSHLLLTLTAGADVPVRAAAAAARCELEIP